MALHTVICRNGNALCGNETMAELVGIRVSCVSAGGTISSVVDDFCAGAATCANVIVECGNKLPPDVRVPVDRAVGVSVPIFKSVGKLTAQRLADVFSRSMRAGMLSQGRHFACVWMVPVSLVRDVRPGLPAQPTSLESSLRHWLCIGVEPSPLSWTGGVALASWSM